MALTTGDMLSIQKEDPNNLNIYKKEIFIAINALQVTISSEITFESTYSVRNNTLLQKEPGDLPLS